MLVIHDKRLPQIYIKALRRRLPGADLFSFDPGIYPFSGGRPYRSIRTHPDIYMFQAGPGTVLCSPGVYEHMKKELNDPGIRIVKGDEDPGALYPETARYNALKVGKMVFHDPSITDGRLKKLVRSSGLEPVKVSQGYARCSAATDGENVLISSDTGLAAKASEKGMKVLKIPAGGIELPGQEYGFIGGASGYLPDGTIVFIGDPGLDDRTAGIRPFLEKAGAGYMVLERLPLFDAGSLIFI